jgi:hypothetical protein
MKRLGTRILGRVLEAAAAGRGMGCLHGVGATPSPTPPGRGASR